MACLSADVYIYLEYGVARAARSAISSADTREAACEAPPPHQTPQSRIVLGVWRSYSTAIRELVEQNSTLDCSFLFQTHIVSIHRYRGHARLKNFKSHVGRALALLIVSFLL